jgi:drug/metabolite transporter (DMT)-like permease
MFYRLSMSLVWGLFMLPHNFISIPLSDFFWLGIAGIMMGVANITLARGFQLASIPIAAPIQYTQLLWGIPLGYFIWHEVPDAYTWIGGAVIVASGLYLLRHESRREAGS